MPEPAIPTRTNSRRDFVSSVATAVTTPFLAAPALAASRRSPNDRVRAAIVGLRGRGRSHIAAVEKLAAKNVELAAVCDIDESVLAERMQTHTARTGNRPEVFHDIRKLLEDRSIDAVFFATPNHWHSLATIWACQAGKDVYVEKPLSHNVFEGRQAVEAARKYGRVVQHGTQNRSSPEIMEGVRRLKDGLIGKVYLARGLAYKWRRSIGPHVESPVPEGIHYDLWKGPGPDRPFSNLRLHNKWHWQWDYGNGELGNQGVHQLDIMRWALDLDDHPGRVQSMGGLFVHEDAQETPNAQTVCYEYPGRDLYLNFEIRPWISNTEAGIGEKWPTHGVCTGLMFYGSDGYMVMPHYGAYYTFLGEKKEPGPFAEHPTDKIRDQPHFDNFIAAVRSGDPGVLTADVEEGHKSSVMAHLGNISYRLKRQVKFDSQSERILGDAEANALLARTYREPFVVREEV